MKKILLIPVMASVVFFTGCNLTGSKQDKTADDNTATETPDGESEPGDTSTLVSVQPLPDNSIAERIISKFNQGPAVNNSDYSDALDYAELYLMLSSDPIALIHGTPDDAERKAAFDSLASLQNKYPYNEQLMEILSQGSELKKTEGGLVPMNEDNRARLDALNGAYDNLAK